MYLEFEEYSDLGGSITDESSFNKLCLQATARLDLITSDRLKTESEIPDNVKLLMVHYVDLYNTYEQSNNTSLSSYSNGTESISYNKMDASQFRTELKSLELEYLGNTGLLYRGGYRFREL